ncbi:hypothetical protein GOBAR_DD24353 [Gossypium barbadense]|nr:hypothetical protein GOBAR_DD24353 [Gossypium barbadense]
MRSLCYSAFFVAAWGMGMGSVLRLMRKVTDFDMGWDISFRALIPPSTSFLRPRNLILGINLEGMVATGTGCGVRGTGLVLMLHDSEDSPLDGGDIDDEHLLEELTKKLDMNMEINKEKTYWEQ